MPWFKQLKTQFDNLVTRLQNTDALVLATIRDVESQIQDAQRDLDRLAGLITTIGREIDALDGQIGTWTTRAVELAATDEATALQCVQFVNQLAQHKAQLQNTRVHHQTTQADLQRVITQLETALTDLSSERQIKRNEAYLANTNAAIKRLQNASTQMPQTAEPQTIPNDSGQLREQLAQMIHRSRSQTSDRQ